MMLGKNYKKHVHGRTRQEVIQLKPPISHIPGTNVGQDGL